MKKKAMSMRGEGILKTKMWQLILQDRGNQKEMDHTDLLISLETQQLRTWTAQDRMEHNNHDHQMWNAHF